MNDFEFNDVGKRLPYSVSEDFFDNARRNAKAVGMKPARSRNHLLRVSLAAATVAVFAICTFIGVYASKKRVLMFRYEQLLERASDEELADMASGYAADFEEITNEF